MKDVALTTGVVTQISPAGNRDFLHIQNIDTAATVYLQYDGSDTSTPPVTLSAANGFPLLPGAIFVIENIGPRNIYLKTVNAFQSSGGTTHLRVQGEN